MAEENEDGPKMSKVQLRMARQFPDVTGKMRHFAAGDIVSVREEEANHLVASNLADVIEDQGAEESRGRKPWDRPNTTQESPDQAQGSKGKSK